MTPFGRVTTRLTLTILAIIGLVVLSVAVTQYFNFEYIYPFLALQAFLPGIVTAIAATGLNWRWRVGVWLGSGLPAMIVTAIIANIVIALLNPENMTSTDEVFAANHLFLLLQGLSLAIALLIVYGLCRYAYRRTGPVEAPRSTDKPKPALETLIAALCIVLPIVSGLTLFSSVWTGIVALFYTASGATLVLLPAIGLKKTTRGVLWGMTVIVVFAAYFALGLDDSPITHPPVYDGSAIILPYAKHQFCFITALFLAGALTTIAAIFGYSTAKQKAFEAMRKLAKKKGIDGQAIVTAISDRLQRSAPATWLPIFAEAIADAPAVVLPTSDIDQSPQATTVEATSPGGVPVDSGPDTDQSLRGAPPADSPAELL